ncbi:hypothetical protein ACHWQZ_G005560 [Mnemiopsis leidyi]
MYKFHSGKTSLQTRKSSSRPDSQCPSIILKGLLEDSRSFNGDAPHLTLNQGFPVIQLSRLKKIAWANLCVVGRKREN